MSVVTIISIQKALHKFRAQANAGRKLTSKGRTDGKELTPIELGVIRTRIEALEKKKEELLCEKKEKKKEERIELGEIKPLRDDRGGDGKPARKRLRVVSRYPDIVQRTIAEVVAERNDMDTTLWHLRHLISDGVTKGEVEEELGSGKVNEELGFGF